MSDHTDVLQALRRCLPEHGQPWIVACSGGRDSSALLHAALRVAREHAVEVVAVHVHHGLQAQADAWSEHVQDNCHRWRKQGWPVRFEERRVHVATPAGVSVEAAARVERYRALHEAAGAHNASTILLAHHERDQAETFLLQALRGAGAPGLAAMPMRIVRAGMCWCRPWLNLPDSAVQAYVRRHRIAHITDDSNADTRWARNRLRLSVWPALLHAFPAADQALSDAARRVADYALAAQDMAQADLGITRRGAHLVRAEWLKLPVHRQRLVLRAWWLAQREDSLPAAVLERIATEWPTSASGQWQLPERYGAVSIRGHRGTLQLVARSLGSATDQAARRHGVGRTGPGSGAAASRETTAGKAPLPPPQRMSLTVGRPRHVPAWGGTLVAEPCSSAGLSGAHLRGLELRPRAGGELFQFAPDRPARSLKKQYQAAGVPPWQREGPLVWSASGELLFVPGLGVDGRQWAAPGVRQYALRWEPDGPTDAAAVPVNSL